jgi:hypothetical protein
VGFAPLAAYLLSIWKAIVRSPLVGGAEVDLPAVVEFHAAHKLVRQDDAAHDAPRSVDLWSTYASSTRGPMINLLTRRLNVGRTTGGCLRRTSLLDRAGTRPS